MPKQISQSSRLRELLPTQVSKLCGILDQDEVWKDMAALILKRNGYPMFDTDRMISLERTTGQSGKSPSREILVGWYTDNPTVELLLDVLTHIGSYRGHRAARYIETDILKLDPETLPPLPSPPDNPTIDLESDDEDTLTLVLTSHPSQGVDIGGKPPSRQGSEEYDRSTALAPGRQVPQPPILPEVSGCHCFTYDFLQRATNNFDRKPLQEGGHFIGEGAFGHVFKGRYGEYPDMAVKRFIHKTIYPENDVMGVKQFINEIAVLSNCHHENLLNLLGYSNERVLCIVYEYMPNGSLEDLLAGKQGKGSLSVDQRLVILKGVAQGLNYLHSQIPPLVHRDIKTPNILLDVDFKAKIGDFGIVRAGPKGDKTSTVTQQVIGTPPYMPLEYITANEVSVKLDAYSYGVVLLEILTGLPALDEAREDISLPDHVDFLMGDNKNLDLLVDKSAGHWGQWLPLQIYKMADRFLLKKRERPTIKETLHELESLVVR